jgi:hypothetical protein
MAYISQLDEEEQKQPGVAATATAAPGVPAVSAPAAAPAHSRFVSFARYLNANRDAAQQSANRLSDNLGQAAQGVEQGLGTAKQSFDAATSAGPTGGYEQVADAKYTGPASLSAQAGWGDLQNQTQRGQERADLTGSGAGVGALLQEGQQGAYSEGARRTDQALVGAVGGDQFAQVRAKYGGLSKRLASENDASVGQANDAQARIGAQAADAKRMVDGYKQVDEDAKDKAVYDAMQGSDLGKAWDDLYMGKSHDSSFAVPMLGIKDYSNGLKAKLAATYGPDFAERWARARQKHGDAAAPVKMFGNPLAKK